MIQSSKKFFFINQNIIILNKKENIMKELKIDLYQNIKYNEKMKKFIFGY